MRLFIVLGGFVLVCWVSLLVWIGIPPARHDYQAPHRALLDLYRAAQSLEVDRINQAAVRVDTSYQHIPMGTSRLVQTADALVKKYAGRAKIENTSTQLPQLILEDLCRLADLEANELADLREQQQKMLFGMAIGGLVSVIGLLLGGYRSHRVFQRNAELEGFKNRIKNQFRTLFDQNDHLQENLVLVERENQANVRKLNEQWRFLAIDGDTGALLRKPGLALLEEAILENALKGQDIVLFFYDLDFFKKVNDRFGHKGGNTVLGEVAKVVARFLSDDLLIKLHGEEFLVVFRETPFEEVCKLAERIRQAIADSQIWMGDEFLTVTISGGLARPNEVEQYPELRQLLLSVEPDSTEKARELASQIAMDAIELADHNMYAAKTLSRNRVCITEDRLRECPNLPMEKKKKGGGGEKTNLNLL